MSIICKQCGYENSDGSIICEICAESLVDVESESISQNENNHDITLQQTDVVNEEYEYFVICPESQTKTVLTSADVTSFYCSGCKREHEIDGFLWVIEHKEKESHTDLPLTESNNISKNTDDRLWLEEINSHYKIEIDKIGGTLGRYGKYGSDFFQSKGMLTVSGEHCVITNEFGNWVIRHVSKTNQTKYNNMILGANEPNILEDGKILTLANTVSFIVRIG